MIHINQFIQKSFQSLDSSIILPFGAISHYLVKSAKSFSYVETLGKHADSLHLWIKKSYEEDFKKSFEIQVRKAIRRLNIHYARLAFDITYEPFYGKTRSLHIINTDSTKKNDGEFQFLTVCLITRNKQIPLMALPVRVGEGSAGLTIKLLEYCQTLFKKIRFAVFDRGFYIAELIDYLKAKKIKYLILVPKKIGAISDYLNKTVELGKYEHQMEYKKKKSKWRPKTNIVICKSIGVDKNGKPINWIFATNINFNSRVEYVYYYKRRWQIETNFRVEDEAKVKSKSTNYLIRYFYFLISLLLHMLWIVNKNIKYYVPFKKYLDIIEQKLLFEFLGIDPP